MCRKNNHYGRKGTFSILLSLSGHQNTLFYTNSTDSCRTTDNYEIMQIIKDYGTYFDALSFLFVIWYIVTSYADLLRRLLKGCSSDIVCAGSYLTGIFPIKRYNTEPAFACRINTQLKVFAQSHHLMWIDTNRNGHKKRHKKNWLSHDNQSLLTLII